MWFGLRSFDQHDTKRAFAQDKRYCIVSAPKAVFISKAAHHKREITYRGQSQQTVDVENAVLYIVGNSRQLEELHVVDDMTGPLY